MSPQSTPEPITIPIKEALRISGLGLTKIYELINDGRVQTVKIDNRRLVIYESLKALLSGAGTDKRSKVTVDADTAA
jgi:hypothetical protein